MARKPRVGEADENHQHGVECFRTVPDAPRIGTALIHGATFAAKPVQYVDIDGMAIVEGDIALGTVAEVEANAALIREQGMVGVSFGVGITGQQFRWPNCYIPYEIDPDLPNQARVTDAIAHWQAKTAFRFGLRTNEANWVYFTDDGGCWSLVGMRGGRQTISLGPGCTLGNTIHEIGHAVGLWHEQSREDRDLFVTINWQNIQSGMASQFQQHITDGDDLGGYDYGSIMHYPRTAFSANGQDTITPVDPDAAIGQRAGLSAGDIAAVQAMYPSCHKTKTPVQDAQKVLTDPLKPIADPNRFKKLLDDHRLKPLRDPIKPMRDPQKPLRDPGVFRQSLFNVLAGLSPGGLRPLSLMTGHHAPSLASAEFSQASDGELRRILLEIDAAIARAQTDVAETNIELDELREAREALVGLLPSGQGPS